MITDGQILEGSLFSYEINSIIKKYKPKTIVEIGTWKGLGSTKRIIDSIIKNNLKCDFISLETDQNFYAIAKNNLKNYSNYVNLIYGKIIEKSDILKFLESNPIADGIFTIEQQKSWLEADIINLEKCPNVLDKIPQNIDFLVLDGGEFSTYPEWIILKNKSKIIALDDTMMQKCKYIKQEILNNNTDYNILVDSDDRNGFMIIENKKYEL